MEYPKPGEELIDDTKQELEISQEKGGALVPSSPQSALESLDALIAQKPSVEKIRELLALKEIALKQKREDTLVILLYLPLMLTMFLVLLLVFVPLSSEIQQVLAALIAIFTVFSLSVFKSAVR